MNQGCPVPGFSPEESAVLDQAARMRRRTMPGGATPTPSGYSAGSGLFTVDELAHAAAYEGQTLTAVLRSRRSRTKNLDRVERIDLARLLWHSARLIDHGSNAEGDWQRRPYPSAGGTHTIGLFVDIASVRGTAAGCYRFNSASCQLNRVDLDAARLEILRGATRQAARREDAAPITVFLLAEPRRLIDRYDAPLTLLMRDAGVCAATLHMVASDLGLASSIIGVAGQTIAGNEGILVCCGAVVVGSMKRPW